MNSVLHLCYNNSPMKKSLKDHLKENPFVLAPMAGITDQPFRSFMREMGAGVVVTELVSATGLRFSSDKTKKLMSFTEDQRPIGVQIFGENLEHMADAAKYIQDQGADFVDINFGCPVPKVVKRGAGSACLRDLNSLRDVIRATKSGIQIPLTIKVRTGWDENSKNTHEVTKIAKEEGIEWVAIHGRTRAQGYSGFADWDYIKDIKDKSPVPIIGNGDIHSAKKALSRLEESGCDGVMIGRGCLKNPWIFKEAMALKNGENLQVEKNFSHVLDKLYEHFSGFYEERLVLLQMKKFSSWFSAGYPSSSQFRKAIFQANEKQEVLGRIQEYFGTLSQTHQEDTSEEAFLMGGHG